MRDCSDGGRSHGGERGVMVCWWRREKGERGKRTKSVVNLHSVYLEIRRPGRILYTTGVDKNTIRIMHFLP
ncbi:hypothetical protein YC2023_029956 [Brassica napus]